jgi:phosphate transport system protein
MQQRSIDTPLNELKEQLITMAGYVEEAVDLSIHAWRARDRLKISRVYQIENKVNQAHLDVDAACLKLLATQQPMAVDLRFILAVVKINTDLERMVDQAVNIANNAEYYLRFPPLPDINDLVQMADATRFMVREAIDAFVNGDEVLASNVLKADDKVDAFKDKIFRDVMAQIKTDPAIVEQGLNIILIARNLERIGDHATNVAEDVIFSVSGQDIRHSGPDKKQDK